MPVDQFGRNGDRRTPVFKELSKLLAYLATLSAPIFITGDFNIRLDRFDDPFATQLNEF